MDHRLKRYQENNLLYASHRMMLPEVDERLKAEEKTASFVPLPEVSEERAMEIDQAIREALEAALKINLFYWDGGKFFREKGRVELAQPRKLRLLTEKGAKLLHFRQIMEASLDGRRPPP